MKYRKIFSVVALFVTVVILAGSEAVFAQAQGSNGQGGWRGSQQDSERIGQGGGRGPGMASGTFPMTSGTPPFASSTMLGRGDKNGKGDMEGGRASGVNGTVTAINNTTLTVDGISFVTSTSGMSTTTVVYTVDVSDATIVKDRATSTVSAITVGDKVSIQGTVSGTAITAKTIVDSVQNFMPSRASTTKASSSNQGGMFGGFFGWVKGFFGRNDEGTSTTSTPPMLPVMSSSTAPTSTASTSPVQRGNDDGGGFFGWLKNIFRF